MLGIQSIQYFFLRARSNKLHTKRLFSIQILSWKTLCLNVLLLKLHYGYVPYFPVLFFLYIIHILLDFSANQHCDDEFWGRMRLCACIFNWKIKDKIFSIHPQWQAPQTWWIQWKIIFGISYMQKEYWQSNISLDQVRCWQRQATVL